MAQQALSYTPLPYEQAYLEGLFQAADVQRKGSIGGGEAVQFFSRSKLSVDALKGIWTVADTPPTNALDKSKFFIAVRLIQLQQNGQQGQGRTLEAPAGITLRPVFFEGVSGVSVPLPLQPPPQSQSMPDHTPPRAPSMGNRPPPQQSSALVTQDPYVMTPSEQSRYETIFPEYAQPDGFCYGKEAVDLFSKSGMPQQQLAQVWNMVDSPVDNRLDKLEFAVAMHLIVCVTKKNLPLPPQLPNSLKMLKSQKPSEHAPTPAATQPQPPPSPGPPMIVQTQPTNPGPESVMSGGMSISDAFEGLSTLDAGPSYMENTPAPAQPTQGGLSITKEEKSEAPSVKSNTQEVFRQPSPTPPAAATPAIQLTKSSEELAKDYKMGSSNEELEKLKATMQKLQAENISLKASLGGMTEEERDVQKETAAVIAEITRLSNELTTVRAQTVAAKSQLMEAKADLKAAKDKKAVVTESISEQKETLQSIEDAREGIEAATEAITAQAAAASPPAPAPAPEPDTDLFFDFGAAPAAPIPQPQPQAPPAPQPHMPTVQEDASVPSATPQFETIVSDASQSQQGAPPAIQPSLSRDSSYGGGSYQQAQSYGAPPPPQQQQAHGAPPPQQQYGAGPPGHQRRQTDVSQFSFNDGDGIMGGGSPGWGPPPTQIGASAPAPAVDDSTPTLRGVEDLKRKAREAEDLARDSEESRRQLSAQIEELRKLASQAEAEVRTLTKEAEESKKKRFGGGKKKAQKSLAKVQKDAQEKKEKLLLAESQSNDVHAIAVQTRSEANRLRREAEDAEMKLAAAQSMAHAQPGQHPNGHSSVPPTKYDPAGFPQQQPLSQPAPGEEYAQHQQQWQQQLKPQLPPHTSGGQAYGGYGAPAAQAPQGGSDPYDNPFE